MADDEEGTSRTKRVVTILTVLSFAAVCVAVITIVLTIPDAEKIEYPPPKAVWGWQCEDTKCVKVPLNGSVQSLSHCKMFCGEFGNMWPKPTGEFKLTNRIDHINIKKIDLKIMKTGGPATDLINSAVDRFMSHIEAIPPANTKIEAGGKYMTISMNVKNMSVIDLNLETDESYTLQIIRTSDDMLKSEIIAETFFGARHALESLAQFIIYDEINTKVLIASNLFIEDKPVYPYRGLLLDTSRNFYTVESLKRTLDAMGACKLNRFHWHITDTHSFSFQSKSYPEISRIGALAPDKFYSINEIKDLVKYGLERGVKIIPEFDAPAHVGEGWQETGLTVCFKQEPWDKYCMEPPCGQVDPTKDELYDVLEGIYGDLFDLFKPDMFHMGGDEVKFECWDETDSIVDWMREKSWKNDTEGFLNLWNYFQTKAQDRAYKVNGKKLPIVLWTSTLVDSKHIDDYLNKEDHIVQVWTEGKDPEIKALLDKGYRLIISNYDALYLDCGFSAWVGDGFNWCSPYKGWQVIYDNSLAEMGGSQRNLILGGEAAMWSEQADSVSIDSRLWPRAGALAERLWAEPELTYTWRNAERRMLQFRERLKKMGIGADSIQPEWCYQNEGHCYL